MATDPLKRTPTFWKAFAAYAEYHKYKPQLMVNGNYAFTDEKGVEHQVGHMTITQWYKDLKKKEKEQ